MSENGEASGGQFARQSNTGLKTGGWGVRRNSTLRIDNIRPSRVFHITIETSADGDGDHCRRWNRCQF